MAKKSRKQVELLEAAEEFVPIEEYDLPAQAEEAQPIESETQPVAPDCVSEADASQLQHQDTTEPAACQEIGPEKAEIGPTTAQNEAPKGLLTLDEIEAQIAAAAAEKARGLIRDLAEAQAELAADEEKYGQAVAEAEACVAEIEARIAEARRAGEEKVAEIRAQAEKTADEAVTVLGEQAEVLLDQILAAQAAELGELEAQIEDVLATLETDLGVAGYDLAQARDELEVVVGLGQARVSDLENELAALATASPAATAVVESGRQVAALVAQAEAFIDAQERNVGNLEKLVEQLGRYAYDFPNAAGAIAGLQSYAQSWYADQLREEVEALQPGRDFEEQLAKIVARAEEAGVEHLLRGDVDAARRRDRQALADKGRQARLFARDLAKAGEAGDVVAYRPGRVTVYRPLSNRNGNGKYRIADIWKLYTQGWEQVTGNPVGRIVSKIQARRRIAVQ
jgi:hypothetical protein